MSEKENTQVNGKDFVIGALVGGIIGAAAALLLAPKSGRELRGDISDGYQTATKKTEEISKSLSEQSDQFVAKVKDVVENVKQDVQLLREKIRKDVSEFTDERSAEAKKKIDAVREEVAATFEEAKRKVEQSKES